jgi:pimeloyl-ACP methyl ester carboxylesterase
MKPFAVPGIGEAWLGATPRPAFRAMMRRIGYVRGSAVARAEIDVHHQLLKRDDGGRAFLRIMRSFQTTKQKSELYARVLAPGQRPVQLIWGNDDPALPADKYGEIAARVIGADRPLLLKARHFLHEDYPVQIADVVASLVAEAPSL